MVLAGSLHLLHSSATAEMTLQLPVSSWISISKWKTSKCMKLQFCQQPGLKAYQHMLRGEPLDGCGPTS